MDEKKKSGFGAGTFFMIFLSFILITFLVIACYILIDRDNQRISFLYDELLVLKAEKDDLKVEINKILKDNNTEENNVETPTEETPKTEESVPIKDRVAFSCESTEEFASVFYAYIDDGYLYYYKQYKKADGNKDELNGAPDFTVVNYYGETTKYEELSGIKRIKMFNHSSSVDPMLLLITESGKVYYVLVGRPKEMNILEYQALANYEVEDILSIPEDPEGEYKIQQKDGSVISIPF